MAGSAQGDEDDSISGINVTPLVDITLVLLIIFMVTASYIVKESIRIELPKAANGGETVEKTLAVLVAKDGRTLLDGQPVDDDGIRRAVAEARAKGDVQAIIAGDKDASHGAVTHVLDVLKGAGVLKFAIQIEKVEKAP